MAMLDLHADSSAIDALGGSTAVGRLCNISPQAVSMWRRKGIPQARRMYLQVVRPEVFSQRAVTGRKDEAGRRASDKRAVLLGGRRASDQRIASQTGRRASDQRAAPQAGRRQSDASKAGSAIDPDMAELPDHIRAANALVVATTLEEVC